MAYHVHLARRIASNTPNPTNSSYLFGSRKFIRIKMLEHPNEEQNRAKKDNHAEAMQPPREVVVLAIEFHANSLSQTSKRPGNQARPLHVLIPLFSFDPRYALL
jgi:hypothetical protein